jgi:hypothetical protein
VGRAVALNENQIKEIAKLPRGVAAVYQNNWVEAVLCHCDKYDDKRPYEKKCSIVTMPYDVFCKKVFCDDGFKSLKQEDVDSVLAWIESSKYARNTKRIMMKAVIGEVLTERERQLIAYNVFEGKTIAKLLSGALTEKEGIERADYFIKTNTEINDNQLIESIRQMIIQVIVSHDNESDLAKRYVDYTDKIR